MSGNLHIYGGNTPFYLMTVMIILAWTVMQTLQGEA